MKKLSVLVLAFCFVLGSLSTAAAVDVKVSGTWQAAYGYMGNWNLYDDDAGFDQGDPFSAKMRFRTQVEFIASETLSGLLHFEIGTYHFGQNDGTTSGSDFAVNGDGANVKTKWAAIDWTLPGTRTHLRMGLQRFALPAGVFANNTILTADAAGIVVNQEFNPTVNLTAFWVRPYDQSNVGDDRHLDHMDAFGFMLPITTSVVRFNPYAMVASVGANTPYNATDGSWIGQDVDTIRINNGRFIAPEARKDHSVAWWAGFTFDLPVINPFVFKLDAAYGHQNAKDFDGWDYEQNGWLVSTQLGYKFDFATVSLFGWYGSGDDDDGYGTLPMLYSDSAVGLQTPAFGGMYGLSHDKEINGTLAGTWGFGFGIDGISFAPNLTHGFRAYVLRGTNSGANINDGEWDVANVYGTAGPTDHHQAYLISSDTVFTTALRNTYKFSSNLELSLDFGYTHLSLSEQRTGTSDDTEDGYSAVLGLGYTF